MARENDQTRPTTSTDANTGHGSDTGRDRYRDNDDVRQPLEGDARTGGSADTKGEARGSARENVGNTSRGTAASPTGAEGNDRTEHSPGHDQYDGDLERDNKR